MSCRKVRKIKARAVVLSGTVIKLMPKRLTELIFFAKFLLVKQLKPLINYFKLQIKFALIIGDDEVATSTVTIKNLETAAQEKVPVAQVPDKVSD